MYTEQNHGDGLILRNDILIFLKPTQDKIQNFKFAN